MQLYNYNKGAEIRAINRDVQKCCGKGGKFEGMTYPEMALQTLEAEQNEKQI